MPPFLYLLALVGQVTTLPSELRMSAEVGDVRTIEARITGKEAEWYVVDKGLHLSVSLESSARVLVYSRTPGRYRVLCWTALGDRPGPAAECVVIVEAPPKPISQPKPAPAVKAVAPVPATIPAYRPTTRDEQRQITNEIKLRIEQWEKKTAK